MGQSRSKPREKKVEEEKSTTTLVTKTKEKVMEKEAKQPDKESQPAESLFGTGTSKHSRPSSSSEGPEMATTCLLHSIAPASRTLCSSVPLQHQGRLPAQCPGIWKAAASQAHKTMLTLKRSGASLAIGKEIFVR
uniref:spermatogenesis-associated protein 33 isoform X2 n=1 Tax=Arvicanthis niloticus TaxID=61156 RepID=UPI001486787E|nr:spermatogenesis-associated protein 33 isoform X2 [Arvicanthis niloticus]